MPTALMLTSLLASLLAGAAALAAARRSARARLRAEGELARALAELDELTHVASHDLTEPLRMVTSYLQLLERREGARLDAQSAQFMAFASDGATRMRALLDDLLRLSRVGRGELRRAPVAVEAVLAQVLARLREPIGEAGATITRGDLPTVAADEALLGQALEALVVNAVTFHRPGARPAVRVSGEAVPGGWRLVVEDDGIGVDPAGADRIFRVFGRLHPQGDPPGTGIGLALCRRIAERHGGTVALEPRAGGDGARFVLTLAADPSRPVAA